MLFGYGLMNLRVSGPLLQQQFLDGADPSAATPHLRNRERPRERDWYSIRLAVHSGATSAGRKPMTTPKAKLALIAPAVLRVNLLEFEAKLRQSVHGA